MSKKVKKLLRAFLILATFGIGNCYVHAMDPDKLPSDAKKSTPSRVLGAADLEIIETSFIEVIRKMSPSDLLLRAIEDARELERLRNINIELQEKIKVLESALHERSLPVMGYYRNLDGTPVEVTAPNDVAMIFPERRPYSGCP